MGWMACVAIIVLGVGGRINNLSIKIKTMQLFCECKRLVKGLIFNHI